MSIQRMIFLYCSQIQLGMVGSVSTVGMCAATDFLLNTWMFGPKILLTHLTFSVVTGEFLICPLEISLFSLVLVILLKVIYKLLTAMAESWSRFV